MRAFPGGGSCPVVNSCLAPHRCCHRASQSGVTFGPPALVPSLFQYTQAGRFRLSHPSRDLERVRRWSSPPIGARSLQLIRRAVVEAYGKGKIVLEPVPKTGRPWYRRAPSFLLGDKLQNNLSHLYNKNEGPGPTSR